jgi:hypothetical protein
MRFLPYIWEVFFIANDFSYAIFPLELIQNEKYSVLSSEEKLLYTLLLNRKNISEKNKMYFQDAKGTFIYYSNLQIQKHLRCSNKTAIKFLNHLESAGLIRKEYQKNGLPLKIYVNDVFGMYRNTYKEKPQDKPSQSNGRNFKPYSPAVPKRQEKEVSFDVSKAEESVHNHLMNFADKKKKRKSN